MSNSLPDNSISEALHDPATVRSRSVRLRELPLLPLAIRLGYQPDPSDPKRWKRHDSIISVNDGKFFDHRSGSGGCGAIDLFIHARSCSCHDAIRFLAEPTDDRPRSSDPRQDFVLPRARDNSWLMVRNYLISIHALPETLVARCHRSGLIFADQYRNALFRCTDAQRQPTGAELVGTYQRPDGSRFRAMPRGSRKHRGSFWLAADPSQLHTACLTESPIDTLSAWCLLPEWRTSGTVFVSTAGTTRQLPDWLKPWNLKRILCAFDAVPPAGDPSAGRGVPSPQRRRRERPGFPVLRGPRCQQPGVQDGDGTPKVTLRVDHSLFDVINLP